MTKYRIKSKKLETYKILFSSLKCDNSKGKAPHKGILLLTIIDLYERKLIKGNRINITEELVKHFTFNWNKFVNTEHYKNFALPFYHMKGEPFWQLIYKDEFSDFFLNPKKIKSIKELKEKVNYALLDEELSILLLKNEGRSILKETLIEAFNFFETESDSNPLLLFSYKNNSNDCENPLPIVAESDKDYDKTDPKTSIKELLGLN